MDRSQTRSDEQTVDQKVFEQGPEVPERMARDDDVLAREYEVVDLQADADDFFIKQERELREGGYY